MRTQTSIYLASVLFLFGPALQAQAEEPAAAAADSAAAPEASASADAQLTLGGDSGASADMSGSGGDYLSRYVPTDGRFEFGAFLGVLFPSGGHDLYSASPRRTYETASRYLLGARLGYYPIKWVGLEVEYMHARGAVSFPDSSPRADFNAARAQVVGQLALWSITPFVVVGGGALQANSRALGPDTDPAFHFGVGAKAAITRNVAFRLDLRETVTDRINDDYAGLAWHEEIQAGVVFNLDAPPAAPVHVPPPDRDRDTVPDSVDKCPDVPALTADGCPADTDGDGIADPQDHCPREKGVAPNGCPDPDEDKDGVPLPCDTCPEEPGVAPDGCPVRDTDGDGILDDVDKCPKEPETKNGFEDDDGCPDTIPEEVKAFTGVIEGIEFDVGKATIRQVSFAKLDKAVNVLKKYPSLRLEVSGHTSSEGAADFNQKLSEDRAASVKTYIVEHGIEANRIETRGAGSSEPVADNKTAAGRARNRRIEFKILQ